MKSRQGRDAAGKPTGGTGAPDQRKAGAPLFLRATRQGVDAVLSQAEARFLARVAEAAALGQGLGSLDRVAGDLRADPALSPAAEAVARRARAPLGEWAEMLGHLAGFLDSWRLVRSLEGPENFAAVLSALMDKHPEFHPWLLDRDRRALLGW